MLNATIVLLMAVCVLVNTAQGESPTTASSATAPSTQPVFHLPEFELKKLPAMPRLRGTLTDLRTRWPAFQHTPYDQAGYAVLVLPFKYATPDNTGVPSIAPAVSFLVSDGLDWGVANYMNYHSFLIFRQRKNEMGVLRNRYAPSVIQRLNERTGSTHAIGGTITATRQGFSATLEIFGHDGKSLHVEQLQEPRDVYELAGDLTLATLRYFGESPNDALQQHLRRQRATRPESLALLGEAAYLQRRDRTPAASDMQPVMDDLDVFELVVEHEPDFAEARFWNANQRWWVYRDRTHYNTEIEQSLKSGLTVTAIRTWADTIPASSHDTWRDYIAQARKLTPDAPEWLFAEVNLIKRQSRGNTAIADEAYRAASRYPNRVGFLVGLASLYIDGIQSPDMDRGISLLLAAAESPAKRSQKRTYMIQQLASGLFQAGAFDQAVLVLESNRDLLEQRGFSLLAQSLLEMGRFEEALAATDEFGNDATGFDWAIRAYAAAICGRQDVFEQVMYGREEKLRNAKIYDALAFLGGVEDWTLDLRGITPQAWSLRAQIYGTARLRGSSGNADHLVAHHPTSRINYFIVDYWLQQPNSYQRPYASAAGLYATMAFLWPDDTFMRDAAEAARHRADQGLLPTLEQALADMPDRGDTEDVPPDEWDVYEDAITYAYKYPIWTVAAIIRQAVADKRFDEARELALRYINVCRCDQEQRTTVVLMHRLLHYIAQMENLASGETVP